MLNLKNKGKQAEFERLKANLAQANSEMSVINEKIKALDNERSSNKEQITVLEQQVKEQAGNVAKIKEKGKRIALDEFLQLKKAGSENEDKIAYLVALNEELEMESNNLKLNEGARLERNVINAVEEINLFLRKELFAQFSEENTAILSTLLYFAEQGAYFASKDRGETVDQYVNRTFSERLLKNISSRNFVVPEDIKGKYLVLNGFNPDQYKGLAKQQQRLKDGGSKGFDRLFKELGHH
ncbi:hypothetical protein [Phocoenobacter skyensis]|uniref:Uncharacterized protein n=1 Tax=Phocoenobacter skyensis TaxID=97481 RepID=A0ABT9JIB6_9PAST|nr:hypothetical protein [Pasteurella skyensis]MDP8078390.1 hypothetical protein [Pasteurella skyensis]MDP8084518.1 hypothetical protein [Pasteurella skyensis]